MKVIYTYPDYWPALPIADILRALKRAGWRIRLKMTGTIHEHFAMCPEENPSKNNTDAEDDWWEVFCKAGVQAVFEWAKSQKYAASLERKET